jgi:topoisomerase-4 subunit B
VFVAMPPLFRVDVGKQVFYALDEEEKRILLERIEKEKIRGAVSTTRFKGLGEIRAAWCSSPSTTRPRRAR